MRSTSIEVRIPEGVGVGDAMVTEGTVGELGMSDMCDWAGTVTESREVGGITGGGGDGIRGSSGREIGAAEGGAR